MHISGEPKALTKTKELNVYKALGEASTDFEYQKHLPFHGCDLDSETKCAFVDFAITAPWGAILFEVDENMHAERPSSCDVRQDFDICASLTVGSGHKVVVLRYNPDSFRIDGKNVTITTKDMQKKLVEPLQAWLIQDPSK